MSAYRSVFHAAVVALLFALPLAAHGHDTLPPDWCLEQDQEPEVVVKFDFDGEQLRRRWTSAGWSIATSRTRIR